MKKQLLAAAVAATFVAGASAAQVELYGGLDGGLLFSSVKERSAKNFSAALAGERTNTLTMESGMSSASKWGMRGSEDFGNGYSVSFNLESGIAMDNGNLKDGKMFQRDCRLTVGTPYGEISFGRMGALSSSAGRYDLVAAYATTFDGGWSTAIGGGEMFFGDFGRMDNTITYMTPTANGFTGYLQYSNKFDDTQSGTEGKCNTGRYVGVGLSFANGPLTIVAAAEANLDVDENTRTTATDPTSKLLTAPDTKVFSLGGNYVFPDGTTMYLVGQYGQNIRSASYFDKNDASDNPSGTNTGFSGGNGYVLTLGTAVPCFGGTIRGSVNYAYVKEKTAGRVEELISDVSVSDKSKFNQVSVALTYEYSFSKRTAAYAGAGFLQQKYKNDGATFAKKETFQTAVGMRHAF